MGTRRNDTLEHFSNGSVTLSASSLSASGDKYYGILVLNDAVIGSITVSTEHEDFSNLEDGNDNVTLLAGTYIPVGFTAITLASGAAIIGKDYLGY